MSTALILSPTVSRRRLVEAEQATYERGRRAGYAEGLDDASHTWGALVTQLVDRLNRHRCELLDAAVEMVVDDRVTGSGAPSDPATIQEYYDMRCLVMRTVTIGEPTTGEAIAGLLQICAEERF